jgi:hypothetical protein
MIRRWRDFDELEFEGTTIYSEMRPHLSEETRGAIESLRFLRLVDRSQYSLFNYCS